MARTMDRGRLREFAREFELRQIIQRLEEELGEDYVPEAEVDEELEVVAEEGTPGRPRQGRGRRCDRRRPMGRRRQEEGRRGRPRRARATSPTACARIR